MNYRIPCEIIRDLMPMYADGLTSETTNREIRVHLEECGTCREMYERMKADMEGRPVSLKRSYPQWDTAFRNAVRAQDARQ